MTMSYFLLRLDRHASRGCVLAVTAPLPRPLPLPLPSPSSTPRLLLYLLVTVYWQWSASILSSPLPTNPSSPLSLGFTLSTPHIIHTDTSHPAADRPPQLSSPVPSHPLLPSPPVASHLTLSHPIPSHSITICSCLCPPYPHPLSLLLYSMATRAPALFLFHLLSSGSNPCSGD